MTRILTDSFELDIEFPEFHPRWTSYTTGFQRVDIDTTSRIDGVQCLQVNDSSAVLTKDFTPEVTELYAGMFLQLGSVATNLGGFFTWKDSGTNTTLGFIGFENSKLVVSADGSTAAATGTTTLTVGTTYHVQFYINYANSGQLTVLLNQNPEVSFTGDTKPGAVTGISRFTLSGAATAQVFIDTVLVNNTSGSVDNTYPGIVRMKLLTPAGPGTYVNNWSRNTGATNWQAVDEVPNDGDSTYLFTSSANIYESFSMTDPGLSNVNYQALITSSIAKKDSGTVQLAVGIVDDDNATNYYVANSALGTSYGIVEGRLTRDPSTGSAWTPSGINATQALIVSTSG